MLMHKYLYHAFEEEQLQGPDGNTGYTWDTGSRLSSITDPSGQVAGFSNDFLDRAYQEWTVGGLATYRTFDAAGREITREQFPTPAVPTDRTGVRLAFYTASYDPRGLLQAVQEVDGHRVVYSYDGSSQLVSEARTGSLSYAVTYTYDGLGNRLSEVENGARTSYTYGSGNRLLRVDAPASGYSPGGVTLFGYDRNGNLASESSNGALTTYTWDEENRLSRAQYPGGVEDVCVYFQDGRRYRFTHNWTDALGPHAVTHLLVWDGQNVLLEQDEALTPRLHYLSRPEAGGQVLGQRQVGSGTDPTRPFFYGHDLSGNARQVIGPGGSFVHGYLYNAFGEVLAESQGGPTVGVGGQVTSSGFQNERNPVRFGGEAGYYADSADRLYVRARYYRPSLGRWISQDPIGFNGGDWNLYGYVTNDPAGLVDPEGQGPTPNTNPWNASPEYERAKRQMAQDAAKSADNALDRSFAVDVPAWIDKNLMFSSVENFGDLYGQYDSSRVSGWKVTGAGVFAGVNVILIAFDVMAVGSAVTLTVKATPEVLARLGIRKAAQRQGAKQAARALSPVVHLTNAAGKAGILSSKKIGTEIGIFALKARQVPKSRIGRVLKTWQGRSVSEEIQITGDALKDFRSPMPIGAPSYVRRTTGVVSSRLGTVDLASNTFIRNQIRVKSTGLFRQATQKEVRAYWRHEAMLYSPDVVIHTGRATYSAVTTYNRNSEAESAGGDD